MSSPPQPPNSDSIRLVYIIDDQEPSSLLSKIMIQESGMTCDIIEFLDAESALKALRDLDDNGEDYPDWILVDINMPGMSGIEFLEAFKSLDPDAHPNSRVVVMTSSINERDRDRIVKHEFVLDFLEKMLDVDKVSKLRDLYFKR